MNIIKNIKQFFYALFYVKVTYNYNISEHSTLFNIASNANSTKKYDVHIIEINKIMKYLELSESDFKQSILYQINKKITELNIGYDKSKYMLDVVYNHWVTLRLTNEKHNYLIVSDSKTKVKFIVLFYEYNGKIFEAHFNSNN